MINQVRLSFVELKFKGMSIQLGWFVKNLFCCQCDQMHITGAMKVSIYAMEQYNRSRYYQFIVSTYTTGPNPTPQAYCITVATL